MHRRTSFIPLFLLFLGACDGNSTTSTTPPTDASAPEAGPEINPLDALPVQEELKGAGLTAPVDVVRDDAGIPHIYAANIPDAAFAQGYMMAQDRWLEMDFGRRQGSGTLAELVGDFSPLAIVVDIRYRTHHLRATAEAGWKKLQASSDPGDKLMVEAMKSFTAGVNSWQAALRAGKHTLPKGIELYYGLSSVAAWSEIDSLVLGELQAFELAFDGTTDILRTAWDNAETAKFVGNADPAKAARAGTADDYWRFMPFDPTFTVDGWKEVPGAPTAMNRGGKSRKGGASPALLKKALASLEGVGRGKHTNSDLGSNNWVIGPQLSASGHAMVANDTHLSLSSPAIFYLNHLSTKDGLDVMGAQFPGIPMVTLGMNRHVAWGGTVNYIDVTDVYREIIVPCTGGAGSCVTFKGAQVKLVPREEVFKTSSLGRPGSETKITFYDVPHHGPILPRMNGSRVEPLGTEELSIRYTGHESAPLFRAIYGVNTAKSADEAVKALEESFAYGGQNWVFADVAGNIAWTQTIRVPRRPKGTKAWKVLPGDGSAEWNGFFEPKVIPHAKNPQKGYLVTANADPVGTTADNDPGNEPEVGGFPLYMGADYDPGTRVGRITALLKEATSGGKKLDRNAMSAMQADAVTSWGKTFQPAFIAAAEALAQEIATPGSRPELAAIVASLPAPVKGFLGEAKTLVQGWSFDTPAGTGEAATPKQVSDSKATAIMAAFATKLAQDTLGDEAAELGFPLGRAASLKLLATLLTNSGSLKTKEALFDDLRTPATETRAVTTAKAVGDALSWMFADKNLGPDPSAWRWGKIHTLTPEFFLPIPALAQKTTPRHGGDGTVDVASHGIEDDDYTYRSGATIRFVCEMDPQKGPIARNVIPGGQVFDPASPHFSDLYDLYVKNQHVELAFRIEDVIERAKAETAKNQIGRRRFVP